MNNKLYIAGATADREALEALRPQFESAGYDIAVGCPDSDAAAMNDGMQAEVAVLWISTKTGQQVYDIADGRKERNATTVNIFAEPMALTVEQKKAVGRNRSVFAVVTPDVAKESVGLIGAVKTNTTAAGALEKSTESASEYTEIKTSAVAVETPQPKSSNVSMESSVGNTVASELAADEDDSSSVMSPWVSFLMIVGTFIVYYWILDEFDYKVNEWRSYIVTAIAFFISFLGIGGLYGWRDHHGKSAFTWIGLALGWISLIVYIYIFFSSLYDVVFD